LSIPLVLPTDKPSVTLSFWWQVQSEEQSGEFDGMSVVAADSQGKPMRSLLTLGSDSTAAQWQQSLVDLSSYSGQAIQLQFVAQTDSSLVTDFFIDDVAVTACSAAAYQVFLPVTQR
jgi:kumamolisin